MPRALAAASASAALPAAEAPDADEPLVGEEPPEPGPEDELTADVDPLEADLGRLPPDADEAASEASPRREPDAGRYGLAVVGAATSTCPR